jgi:hypothetical protein
LHFVEVMGFAGLNPSGYVPGVGPSGQIFGLTQARD